MYKLKDIISSGGTNPKINKAIDRYELSKDEKKDIISTIKTNVPQSGGSGSEGGGSNWRYFRINDDFADNSTSKAMAFGLFHICRYQLEGQTIFGNIARYIGQFETTNLSNAYAVAVDADVKFFTNMEEVYSFNEAEMMLGGVGNLSLTEITKEEFYNLES